MHIEVRRHRQRIGDWQGLPGRRQEFLRLPGTGREDPKVVFSTFGVDAAARGMEVYRHKHHPYEGKTG